MNLFSLEGKISFVTGAGSGIGQRLARDFAVNGAFSPLIGQGRSTCDLRHGFGRTTITADTYEKGHSARYELP